MRYLGFEPGGGAYQHGPLWGKTSILHQNLMYLIIGNFKTLHEINSIIETVKNPLGCQISSLDPFVRLAKKAKQSILFQLIRLTLFLLSQQVLFFCERHVNFLHFEMLPNFLHLKVSFH